MGNFLSDKANGEKAEQLVLSVLSSKFPNEEFSKVEGRNSKFDIMSKNGKTIEVKFDIMAKKTGNLCFEFTNGKKQTGVCASTANEIWYVLQDSETDFTIIMFERAKLLQDLLFLSLTKEAKVLYGGDNKKFGLIIIPLSKVLELKIGEELKWQVQKK